MSELTDFEKTEKIFNEVGIKFEINTLSKDFMYITILNNGYAVCDLYFTKKTGVYEDCD